MARQRNYPDLFKDQPLITADLLAKLTKQGLIVPDTTRHESERRDCEVANPSAGQVVGYTLLAARFTEGKIDQETARVLLVVEATREGGPRKTHVDRLLANAWVGDRRRATAKIKSWVNR
tara:strand:+ start:545 stop:904 length:360 start_codon:yes stop_codon:yes gene_type:complete